MMKSINQLYHEFNDNSTRVLVEPYLKKISNDAFEQTIDYLLESTRNQQQEIKIFSIILFKSTFLQDPISVKRLTKETCSEVSKRLFLSMSSEDDKIFIKLCLEVIVKLAALHAQECTLFSFLSFPRVNVKQVELQLLFLQAICTYSFNNQELEKNYKEIQNLLEVGFQQVQIICFETFCVVLRNIGNERLEGGFQQLITKLIEFVRERTLQEAIMAMMIFNQFIDKEKRAPKDGFELLMKFYLELLKNTTDVQLITQTMNGLRIVAERLGPQMRQYSQTPLLTLHLMDMVALIEAQQMNTLSLNDISTIAAETLQEFVQWLGPQYVYSILKGKILVVLEEENWKLQHSGLSAVLAVSQEIKIQIDEFSSEELMKQTSPPPLTPHPISYIVPLQNSTNKTIINDILEIYGWFCYLFKPDLQFNEAEEIFEFICRCFKNNSKEILEKAVLTLKIYIENSNEDAGVVGKLIDNQTLLIQGLLGLLLKFIRDPQIFRTITQVLNLFASTLQENLNEEFYFHIKKIMTMVLEIPEDTVAYIEIRTSAIQSLGVLIFSINSNIELLKQEAFPTLNTMIQLYDKYTSDNPHHTAILHFIGQLAAAMKDQFFHYHKTLFPLIFRAANLEIETSFPLDRMEEEGLMEEEVPKCDNQEDSLNQIQVDKKLEAFKCIKQLIQNAGGSLKKQFKEEVFDLFVQYLSYTRVQEVRNANAEILKVLLFTTENDIDMAEIFNKAYSHLNNMIQLKGEGGDISSLVYFFNILNSCLKQFRNQLVKVEELNRTLLYASRSLSIYEKNFLKIEEKYSQAWDKENKENEQNLLTDVLDEVVAFSGYVLEFHAGQFGNLICNNIASLFLSILQTEFPLTKQVNAACCFCCYAFEYLSEDIFQLFTKKIFKFFLSHGTKSQDIDIQQNICFGIGLVSRRMDPESYKECRQVCLTFLDFLLEHKQAHTEKRIAITEIAIASLGKVALFQCHQDPKIREKLINKFLSSLPLKNEPEDSQELHQLLIDQIFIQNPAFQNCSPQTFKKLQSTMQSIRKYHEDHPELEILTDEGYYAIGRLDFSQLQSQISG